MTLALRIASLVGIGLGIATFVYIGASTDIGEDRTLGLRGLKRRRALEHNALFAAANPLIRFLARGAVLVPLGNARARLSETLEHAGDWLGLDANEFVGLSLLTAIGGLAVGAPSILALDLPGAAIVFMAGLGAALPYIIVTGEAQRRAKTISRALPGAIDLGALCMTAGLSFPQTITQIVSRSGSDDDPLNEEFSLILQQLRLGKTRKRALQRFAERVPSATVRSFVSAVVQSEERGTPLTKILQIQARTLRERRSVSAEEAASRAAVLMIMPLMLIFAAIIIILLGPFVIQGQASGF